MDYDRIFTFWMKKMNSTALSHLAVTTQIAFFLTPIINDSDQKSMIDHFRLIGWKTIDFFFRSWNFDNRFSIIQFWNEQMIDFFRFFPDFFFF